MATTPMTDVNGKPLTGLALIKARKAATEQPETMISAKTTKIEKPEVAG